MSVEHLDVAAETAWLKPETVDSITETLVRAPSAAVRADIVCELIAEVCATVRWLGSFADPREEAHLAVLLMLSDEHRQIMRSHAGTEGQQRS